MEIKGLLVRLQILFIVEYSVVKSRIFGSAYHVHYLHPHFQIFLIVDYAEV